MNPNFFSNRTVFVTGATGLLGSALVQQLVKAGARVVCLVRDQVPTSRLNIEKELHDAVIAVSGDIVDARVVERVMFEYEPSCVFHLAAQTLVGVANRSPVETLRVNIEGTWNMLEAFRRYSAVTREKVAFVLASSDKAYGNLHGESYDELTPLRGEHPYDVSKSCADLIAQTYAKTYGLNIGITRCGNFFGPGDLNGSRLIPGTIMALLRGQKPIIRSDGSLVRDYIYVDDGALAYCDLAEALLSGKVAYPKIAFNFSYGDHRSVLAVVGSIIRKMGLDIEPVVLNEANNEIPVQKLNSAFAREALGWQPRYGFDEGLARTVEWYKKNIHLLRGPSV
jgi:CDP-glucose 4,6-dehydratase